MDQISMLIVPGTEGDLGIMAGHTPLITFLRQGTLKVMRGKEIPFSMTFFEEFQASANITPHDVTILIHHFCPLEWLCTFKVEDAIQKTMPPIIPIESPLYGDYRIGRELMLHMDEGAQKSLQTYTKHHKNPFLTQDLLTSLKESAA